MAKSWVKLNYLSRNRALEINSKDWCRSSGKWKDSRLNPFSPSTKREIRQFHVVVVKWRQTVVEKAWLARAKLLLILLLGFTLEANHLIQVHLKTLSRSEENMASHLLENYITLSTSFQSSFSKSFWHLTNVIARDKR